MIRYSSIFVFLIILVTGCGRSAKPIWEDVKLGDLMATGGAKATLPQQLKTIDFDIYIFEMPAVGVTALDEVWPKLYTSQIAFRDRQAFDDNFFSVGLGEQAMWDNVAGTLRDIGAKKTGMVSLYLIDAQPNDVTAAGVYGKQSIYYTGSDGSKETATIGPGKLVFRMQADKTPGSRGVCRLNVVPVFSPPGISAVPQLAERLRAGEVVFEPLGFSLRISPGSFVFLGPKRYLSPEVNLTGRLFCTDTENPVVRTYLIVCARIID
jgi:hypothetical protein